MYENDEVLLDISYYQGHPNNIDWAKVRDVGKVRGIWTRLNYGIGFKDPFRDGYVRRIEDAGMHRADYTFPLPHRETPQQAFQALINYSGGNLGDLPVMVDGEDPPGVDLSAVLGAQGLANWYIDFGLLIQQRTGVKPIMYGGAWFGMANDRRLADVYPHFWVANYGSTADYNTLHYAPTYRPNYVPPVPGPWSRPASIFQHSGGNGRCPGIPLPVDLDLVPPKVWASLTNDNFPAPVIPDPSPQPQPEANMAPPIHEFPDGAQYFLAPCSGPVVADHNGQPTDLSGGKEMIWIHLLNPVHSFDAQVSGLVSPNTVHIPAEDQAAIDRFERYGIANGPMKRPPVRTD